MAVAIGDDLHLRNDTSSQMLALHGLEQSLFKHLITLFRRSWALESVHPNVEWLARTAVLV